MLLKIKEEARKISGVRRQVSGRTRRLGAVAAGQSGNAPVTGYPGNILKKKDCMNMTCSADRQHSCRKDHRAIPPPTRTVRPANTPMTEYPEKLLKIRGVIGQTRWQFARNDGLAKRRAKTCSRPGAKLAKKTGDLRFAAPATWRIGERLCGQLACRRVRVGIN